MFEGIEDYTRAQALALAKRLERMADDDPATVGRVTEFKIFIDGCEPLWDAHPDWTLGDCAIAMHGSNEVLH